MIGALVDHGEAHVLEHRHPLGQRQRPAVAPQLEAGGTVAARGALEVDAERGVRRHLLDGGDVLDRGRGGEGIAVSRRERPAVTREQIARRRRVVRGEQRLEQEIRPRLHDSRDLGFELRAVGMGERDVAARDDEMHANQRTFGEVRNERSDLAVEGLRQHPADHGARAAAIGLARHVDEDRGESLVKVEAGEHPHPRPSR